jgi:hypothetical protein
MPRHRSGWPGRVALGLIAGSGLLCSQAIDLTLNTNGLLFLDIVVGAPVVGRAGMALGIALVVQATVIASELTLADAGGVRRGLIAPAFAGVMFLLAAGLGGALHGMQLSNLAKGGTLLAGLRDDVAVSTTQVVAISGTYASTYVGELRNLDQLADDSAAGHDPTRIAKCRGICQEERGRAWQLRQRFSGLAQPVTVSGPPPADAHDAYAALKALVNAARLKAALLKDMCDFLGKTCADPLAAVLDDPAYQRVERAFNQGETPDRVTLVLRGLESDLKAARDGQLSPLNVLLLALVALLPLCELALVIFLRLAFTPPPFKELLEDLRRENAGQMEQARLKAGIYAAKSVKKLMEKEVE